MKNKKNIILLIIFLLVIIGVVFIFKYKNDIFNKNKEKIEYSSEKGKVTLYYDKDIPLEISEINNKKVLKNRTDKYKISLEFKDSTFENQKKLQEKIKTLNSFVVEDIKINKYEGFVQTDKRHMNSNIYLYLDESNDAILLVKLYSLNRLNPDENNYNKDNLLYNRNDIKNILKTISYSK